jgi:hypothetical protein
MPTWSTTRAGEGPEEEVQVPSCTFAPSTTVVNLTVEGPHTFDVADAGDAYLVHNKGGGGDSGGGI